MPTKEERDKIIQRIIRTLFNEKAHLWSVQDKGVLLAAVKLALKEAGNSQ